MSLVTYLFFENGNYKVEQRTVRPLVFEAVVPSTIDVSDYQFLKSRQVLKPGTTDEYYTEAYIDEILKGQWLVEKQKSENARILRQSYLADIDAEMLNIFGTTDRDKANAIYNTWKEWKEDPSFFAPRGLLDDQGDPLDTASKISLYAQNKISLAKDYSVFLMTREKQYKDALAAL